MDLRFDFIGPINDENFLALRNFIVSQEEKPSSLIININSLGGAVPSGIGIYNFLKQMPFHITTRNMGEVSSSAILLYLAGNTRIAEPVSKFVIHPISMGINGDLPYYQVQEILRGIEADINNFKKIVNQETLCLARKYDVEQFLKSDSLILDVHAAYELGIVTNV